MNKTWYVFSILLALGALFTFQASALTVKENWEVEVWDSLSKKDIKEIIERVGNTTVNGQKFDLKKVQNYFDDVDPGDYKDYWEQYEKFEKDYGKSNLAQLLFHLAMGDYNIQKYERRFKTTLPEEQQVAFEDYRFIESKLTGRQIQSLDTDFENSCVIAFAKGDNEMECEHDKGSSGLFGAAIFLATLGNLGTTNGYRRETTTCTNHKIVKVLLRSRNQRGEEVVSSVPYKAYGISVVYNQNVWFRGDMKKDARRKAEIEYSFAEDKLVQYSCDRHRPWDNIHSTLELQRPLQTGDRESLDLDHDDIIDPVLVPSVENTTRNEIPANPLPVIERDQVQDGETVAR